MEPNTSEPTKDEMANNVNQSQGEDPPIEAQLAFLDDSILDAKSKVNEAIRTRRNSWGLGVLGLVGAGIYYGQVLALPLWVIIAIWILVFICFFAGLGADPEKSRIELEKLESRKRLYFNFFNIKTDEAYFDQLVKINIENLGEYYTLVKIHTGQSFNASLAVALAGFCLISAGLIAGFFNESLRNISYLSSASGVFVQLIAGTMFYMYSKTVRQLKSYHDSLLDVQNILLSFKLIEGTDDKKERSIMTQKMIEFLVGHRRTNQLK